MRIIEFKSYELEVKNCSQCLIYYQSPEWQKKLKCRPVDIGIATGNDCPLKERAPEYEFDGDGRFGPDV